MDENSASDHRVLRVGQRCRLHLFDVATLADTVVAEFDDVLYEAPNWSVDGRTLYLNGRGELWAFPLDSPQEQHAPATPSSPGSPANGSSGSSRPTPSTGSPTSPRTESVCAVQRGLRGSTR